jgi:hypothetical protein
MLYPIELRVHQPAMYRLVKHRSLLVSAPTARVLHGLKKTDCAKVGKRWSAGRFAEE